MNAEDLQQPPPPYPIRHGLCLGPCLLEEPDILHTKQDKVPYRVNKKLGTVEANASQTFDDHLVEADVEHWFCQLYMPKMTRAFRHIPSARLAAREAIDRSLPWIHEASQLWPSAFHCFRVFYASLTRNRHLFLLK